MNEKFSQPILKPSSEMYVSIFGSCIRDDDEQIAVTITLGKNHHNTYYRSRLQQESSNVISAVDAFSDDDCSFEMT